MRTVRLFGRLLLLAVGGVAGFYTSRQLAARSAAPGLADIADARAPLAFVPTVQEAP